MAVEDGLYLKRMYSASRALGAKIVSSDATFQIQEFEHLYLLCKEFPHPRLSLSGNRGAGRRRAARTSTLE